MNELSIIINRMEEVFTGHPWYGKAIIPLLNEVKEDLVYEKIHGHSHSIIEVLFHMINWQEFTLHQLEEDHQIEPERYQLLDWRETNPALHTWNTGKASFTAAHNKIIELLKTSTDELLDRKVSHREYNMRVLLNGIIEHNIYHTGQIAFINKSLAISGS